MFIIIGYVIIVGCVVGGFALSGGHLAVLFQPIELLVIGGASAGAFVVATPKKHLGATFKAVPAAFKGVVLSKEHYMNLLALLFDILGKVRKEGLMSVEGDVENPDASPLFQKYPEILKDHHLIEFICDYLRLMVSGNLNPLEIENLMDNELETHHHEALVPSHAITRVSDGLPAMGIVAAVLGVVHTMGLVGQPPAVLGHAIGAALVGTFMGILMSYGFVGPVANLMAAYVDEEAKQYQCVKVTLLASLNGYAPQIAVEFGRKVLFAAERPTFSELEGHVKKK